VGASGKVTPDFQSAGALASSAPLGGVAVAAHALPASLRVRGGPNAGEKFDITVNRVIIGRRSSRHFNAPFAVFMLDDNRVSREHVEIVRQPDGVYLRDMASSNGTWLNGKQLENYPVRLSSGDEIRLGTDTVLTYQGEN
jgi:pSer/pThr/pTyr-binding forkhead associated (FHA) protein